MNSLPFSCRISYRKSTSIIFLGADRIFMTIIAGFLNCNHGGTLLIGVADNGDINDLENDYQILKKQNQDGFEQAIMTAISNIQRYWNLRQSDGMGPSSKDFMSQLGDINS